MRWEHLQQISNELFGPPKVTLADIETTMRKVARTPEQAERMVGSLYGGIFKRKEAIYERQGGRWVKGQIA